MVILIHFLLLPVASDLKAKILARLLSQKLPQQVESLWEKLPPGIFPLQKIICLYGKESSICTTFLGRKRENYTVILRTAFPVPVLLSVSRLTPCAGSSLGWELPGTPWLPRVSGWWPNGTAWPQKGAGCHVALQSGPGLGTGSGGSHRGVGGVRQGCPVLGTAPGWLQDPSGVRE